MSFLNNLFGRSASKNASLIENVESSKINDPGRAVNIPPKELFIDNTPPAAQITTEEHTTNKIRKFISRDYFSLGFKDGYEYHSNDILESGKKKIKADFLLILDQSIEEKQRERLKTKNLLIDVYEVSDDAYKKLENTIEEMNISINTLHKQKELSCDNEGWVMTAIHAYHMGFKQGIDDYIAGEELLNSVRNIGI